jgi:catechol 2,3-dioxygenase-like lactoylglutathione lyase family enzyme
LTDRALSNGGRVQVGIVVCNLAPMIEFYTEVLGLTHFRDIAIPGGTLKQFVLGDASVKLVSFDVPPELANPSGGSAGGARGLRYLTIEVDDVAATVGQCTAAGCEVSMPLFEYEGAPVAIVQDPEGNWVELIQPPR